MFKKYYEKKRLEEEKRILLSYQDLLNNAVTGSRFSRFKRSLALSKPLGTNNWTDAACSLVNDIHLERMLENGEVKLSYGFNRVLALIIRVEGIPADDFRHKEIIELFYEDEIQSGIADYENSPEDDDEPMLMDTVLFRNYYGLEDVFEIVYQCVDLDPEDVTKKATELLEIFSNKLDIFYDDNEELLEDEDYDSTADEDEE